MSFFAPLGRMSFFDMNQPGANLASEPRFDDRASALRKRIEFHRALDHNVRLFHGSAEGGPRLNPGALERLRSLGYLR